MVSIAVSCSKPSSECCKCAIFDKCRIAHPELAAEYNAAKWAAYDEGEDRDDY